MHKLDGRRIRQPSLICREVMISTVSQMGTQGWRRLCTAVFAPVFRLYAPHGAGTSCVCNNAGFRRATSTFEVYTGVTRHARRKVSNIKNKLTFSLSPEVSFPLLALAHRAVGQLRCSLWPVAARSTRDMSWGTKMGGWAMTILGVVN